MDCDDLVHALDKRSARTLGVLVVCQSLVIIKDVGRDVNVRRGGGWLLSLQGIVKHLDVHDAVC